SFLAVPFEILDHRDERPPEPWLRNLVSILLQAVPFSILAFLIAAELQRAGASAAAQNFAAVAILLGNTAAAFMGVFFGHALSARRAPDPPRRSPACVALDRVPHHLFRLSLDSADGVPESRRRGGGRIFLPAAHRRPGRAALGTEARPARHPALGPSRLGNL